MVKYTELLTLPVLNRVQAQNWLISTTQEKEFSSVTGMFDGPTDIPIRTGCFTFQTQMTFLCRWDTFKQVWWIFLLSAILQSRDEVKWKGAKHSCNQKIRDVKKRVLYEMTYFQQISALRGVT